MDLDRQIADFAQAVGRGEIEIYNEFSLQHELGIFLRASLPGCKVQFERNVSHFNSTWPPPCRHWRRRGLRAQDGSPF